MTVEEIHGAVQELRTVELRRAVRGVDPEQARELLDKAADLLAAAEREHTRLRDEIERLRQAKDESAVGKALVTATRAGEALLAEAREEAAALMADAKAQASALFEEATEHANKRERETEAARKQFERELADARKAHVEELESARADADGALAAARRELAQLENEAAKLRSLVTDMERRIVEIAQGALAEIAELGASAGNPSDSDLLADLQPGVTAPSDVATD